MATAKWATPSAQGSNIASTTLDSLANAQASSFITYDNSSNRDIYAFITVKLGSFTSTAGAYFRFHIFAASGSDVPDNTATLGGGDVYTVPLTVGASAKVAVFKVTLPPASLRFSIVNLSGATFASSLNAIHVQPHNEDIT